MAEFLSQEEIDSLMDIKADGEDFDSIQTTKTVDYTTYNFKKPNLISSESIRTISQLHDKVLRDLANDLSSVIKKMVDISIVSVDQITYSEFTMSLSDNTIYNIFSLDPSDGKVAVESNPLLSRMVIDYLMGAKKELEEGDEDIITDLEISILNHFLDMLQSRLVQAWKPVAKMDFKLLSQNRDPNNAILVSQGDVIVLMVLEINIEENKELLNLCYPKIFLEPLLASGDLNRSIIDTRAKKSRNEDINSLLAGSKVSVDGIIAQTSFAVKEILKLSNDDTIIFNEPIHSLKGKLVINNKDKFLVDFGIQNDRKSAQLVSPVLSEHQETIMNLRGISKKREVSKDQAREELLKVLAEKE